MGLFKFFFRTGGVFAAGKRKAVNPGFRGKRHFFCRVFLPVETLIHAYNLLVVAFVLVFSARIPQSASIIAMHLAGAVLYIVFQSSRNRRGNPLLQAGTVLLPLVFLSAFHYETGFFNQMIFQGFLDDYFENLGTKLLGFTPYLISRTLYFEWLAQLSHAAYASFYFLLVVPVMVLYFRERKAIGNGEDFWERASRLREMQFVLIFTMLCCYMIAVVFPVKGPTEFHSLLFRKPAGMVAIMNFLFSNGDLDGGAMPSSHVAGALVVVIYSCRFLRRWFWVSLGVSIPMTLSTVYNSYHYAADVVAGFAAGGLFYFAGRYLFRLLDPSASNAAALPTETLRQEGTGQEESREYSG